MIRPIFNRKVVMNPEDAAELATILHPRIAVPIHYRYTAGFLRDHLLLKYHNTPDALPHEFLRVMAAQAPSTVVRILEPGERLVVTR